MKCLEKNIRRDIQKVYPPDYKILLKEIKNLNKQNIAYDRGLTELAEDDNTPRDDLQTEHNSHKDSSCFFYTRILNST